VLRVGDNGTFGNGFAEERCDSWRKLVTSWSTRSLGNAWFGDAWLGTRMASWSRVICSLAQVGIPQPPTYNCSGSILSAAVIVASFFESVVRDHSKDHPQDTLTGYSSYTTLLSGLN
jgi:hypothetical protein